MNPSPGEVELSDLDLESVFGGLSRVWPAAWQGRDPGDGVPPEEDLTSSPEA
jgi:hypothetical protein